MRTGANIGPLESESVEGSVTACEQMPVHKANDAQKALTLPKEKADLPRGGGEAHAVLARGERREVQRDGPGDQRACGQGPVNGSPPRQDLWV